MSFRLKTILGIALIETVLLAVLIYGGNRFIAQITEDLFVQRADATIRAFSATAKAALIASDIGALEALAGEMMAYPGVVFARVTDADGHLVASSGQGEGRSLPTPWREDATVGSVSDGVFHRSARVAEAGVFFGTIALGLSVDGIQTSRASALNTSLMLAGAELLLVALFSWALGTVLTRELANLARGARRIADGNYGFRMPVNGKDELAQTAVAFNQMGEAVGRSMQALATNEAHLRQVHDSTSDGLLLLTRDGHLIRGNRGAAVLLGLEPDKPLAMRPYEQFDALAQVIDDFSHSSTSTALSVHQLELVMDGGRCQWIEVRLHRIDVVEEPGTLVVLHDIEQHKRLEYQLVSAKRAAEDAYKAKSEFLAAMSHEIRTPMHGVLGSIEMLKETGLRQQQARYLETADTSARILLDVINDILDFSRIEAGKVNIESLTFDLYAAVEDVSRMLAHRAHSKRLELACYIAPDVPEFIQSDPARLRQILANLLGNAIKFTDHGEVVTSVAVERAPSGGVPYLRFSVQDTGIGVPGDKRDRLFQPFTQVDGSTSRRFGGTGLGLSISSNLVALMGGAIGYEPSQPQGSVFWFRLPLVSGYAPPAGARFSDVLAGKHVLVVDDNATNRIILHRYLANWSCLVESAASGQEALAKIGALSNVGRFYDIALLDLNMPGMDGYELIRAIQSDSRIAAVPVIMLSSSAQDARRMRGLRVDVWLDKPVRQMDLRDAMSSVLNGLRGQSQPMPLQSSEEGAKSGLALQSTEGVGQPRTLRMMAPDPKLLSKGDAVNVVAKLQAPEGVADRQSGITAAVDPPVFPGVSVLLAEDNLITQEIAGHMLTSLALTVTPALDGLEAVAAFEAGSFDLVLMDIQMPHLNGYEATGRIREVERRRGWARTPIIALTAFAMPGDREKCLAADMDDYVVKPYGREAIVHIVRQWVVPGGHAPSDAALPVTTTHLQPHSREAVKEVVFDEKRIRDLKSVMGNAFPSLITSIADALLANAQLVQQAIESGDVSAALSAAHKLKNTAGEIGAGELRAQATEIEQAARAGQLFPLSDLPLYTKQVSDAVRKLR